MERCKYVHFKTKFIASQKEGAEWGDSYSVWTGRWGQPVWSPRKSECDMNIINTRPVLCCSHGSTGLGQPEFRYRTTFHLGYFDLVKLHNRVLSLQVSFLLPRSQCIQTSAGHWGIPATLLCGDLRFLFSRTCCQSHHCGFSWNPHSLYILNFGQLILYLELGFIPIFILQIVSCDLLALPLPCKVCASVL